MRESRDRLLVAAILFLALVLRVWGIFSRPIWYDEAFSMLFAEKGLDAMLYGTLAPTAGGVAADIHPLGYYTLLWLWLEVFGNSLAAARLLSIVAGLASVYLVRLVALEAAGSREAALLGMLIAALSPFQIHYAQEIRMYSFLTLWLLLATYAYQRAAKTAGWKWWGSFSAAAALAQYTHNLAAFYLLPLAMLPLLQRDWPALRGVALGGLGALLLYLPWLVHVPAQLAKVQTAYWVERPDVSKLFTLLLVFTSNTPLPPHLVAPALLIALLVVSVGILQTIRQVREGRSHGGVFLLYLALSPPVLLFLVSLWRPVYVERALLASGAMFGAWLGWSVLQPGLAPAVRNAVAGLLLLTFSTGIIQHLTYRGFPYGPYDELTESLQARATPGDAVVHANKLTYLPALYFAPGFPQEFIGDAPGSRVDTLAPATQEVLGIEAEDADGAAQGASRVWLIIHQRALDEYTESGGPTHPVVAHFDSLFTLEALESWDDLRVFVYVRE